MYIPKSFSESILKSKKRSILLQAICDEFHKTLFRQVIIEITQKFNRKVIAYSANAFKFAKYYAKK